MNIVFYPDNHKYINDTTNEEYISVTTLLGKYKKPFDIDGHSKRIARREGLLPEAVLEIWKETADKGHARGNKYHKIMEDYLKDKVITEGFEDLIDSFYKKISSLIKNSTIINSEKLLWNHDYRLAGTADLIIENKNDFAVLDFKTNKKFDFYSKYNEYMLEPVDHLMNCEYSGYALQVSIYAYMYEILSRKKCMALKIFYLRDSQGKYWQEFNVPFMKHEVENLLNNYIATR